MVLKTGNLTKDKVMSKDICSACGCAEKATHVLAGYNHTVSKSQEFFCLEHAFDDDREGGRFCSRPNEELEVDGEYYVPTYPPGTLKDGCCGVHP